jgi:hypothetical protein
MEKEEPLAAGFFRPGVHLRSTALWRRHEKAFRVKREGYGAFRKTGVKEDIPGAIGTSAVDGNDLVVSRL